ncbi:ABC transporter CDR4 [Purpureocillium lilacinum]|uniref:ABC transporter CDR4 n=1 Tax=Purpureocillium lilacinum TaxID=33203 RepID=A0A179FER7_PURLI|nr:ABC transporter CDR4 [Purpureocillium lilacinum]
MSDARFEKTAIAESEVTTLNPKADEATAFNSTPGSEHASDDKLEIQRRHSAVRDLARQFTQTSGIDVQDNPSKLFHHDDPESPLNPNGNCFNARIWAKTLAKLTESTSNGFRRSGFAFQHMNVHGYGSATGYQKDVANVLLEIPNLATRLLRGSDSQHRIDILRDFDGVVNSGEMLVVLGPPGSGCSTFLKSIAGETNGLHVDKSSYINYNGITAKEMHSNHSAEAIYTAELDVHFPQLTVGETLTFASRARLPRDLPGGVSRNDFADHYRDVVMAMYGISHTVNTRVGNDLVRGVSGGERKRVSIAEATLANAPLQFWDNSTRGLDSANALEFCKTLRQQSHLFGQTCAVSIYQASQSAYSLFDKVTVLYEGRQIYFGPTASAKQFFVDMGFECPISQTDPDFLTSLTSPLERVIRPGFENRVPRTPDEFAARWKESREYQLLQNEIESYKVSHPFDGADAQAFRDHKRAAQARSQRAKSAFILSYGQQIMLCLWRGWKRLKGDPSITVFSIFSNMLMALVVSSIFYNLPQTTESFFPRSTALFFSVVINSFSSFLEVLTQYAQRPIVEKQSRYGFYHASAEAWASVLMDMPYKIGNCIGFNLIFYFMVNLNRSPGPFFYYLFVNFLLVLTLSGLIRSIASLSRSLAQALVPGILILLSLIIFTGFVVPIQDMLGWCRWINYLDPVAYGFESLMVNEFHGRTFDCNTFLPPMVQGYENLSSENRACIAVGSVAGESVVQGTAYIGSQYSYFASHKWRNVGIIIAFAIFNHFVYFAATELITAKKSKGEVLVFRRGHVPAVTKGKDDPEAMTSGPVAVLEKHKSKVTDQSRFQGSTSVFHWRNICYNVMIKKEDRRILDHVDGWVKPGTLTALMGVSGAGKTTLLDCLADRTSVGVITGEMLVDGKLRDESFQRKTGYVQQQDVHLETTTVREALEFSAVLRQPRSTPYAEKISYVDEVIKLLEMESYADAIVGRLGEGLNVEQRKRLTIGVELAAKPPLLLFVDEPTSGLDSQTSWAILDLLEKLSKAGQSVLCTIHQPSAMLFQRFDRLLFLAKGGKTVYFGDIGNNSETLKSYFERYGAPRCPEGENPAEWMLEAIGAAPGSVSDVDWFEVWRNSPEFDEVQKELERLKALGDGQEAIHAKEETEYDEFAAPLLTQMYTVTKRAFEQYWRTPVYIYAKMALGIGVALFIGLVFLQAPLSRQGLQNQMFAFFMVATVFNQLVQQQMPYFVVQRDLYEARERPSKTYSWKVFMLSQIFVEIPWNSLLSVFMFICLYYPVGYNNIASDAGEGPERGALAWLLMWQFLIFTCTMGNLCIVIAGSEEGGGGLAQTLFMFCLAFCGVLAGPDALPGFWIFMYRVSPITYWISALLSTGLAHADVVCAANEYISVKPPGNDTTCMEFLGPYIKIAGGYLLNEDATNECNYCPIATTDDFLTMINASYSNRWRDFGIGMVYIVFNIAAATLLYWVIRMPKGKKVKKE